MNKGKQIRLDQIAADMVKDHVCPDLAKTAKNLVPGEGNPNAAVVFIGEAPGKHEDETGRPFVGAAGKFLDELLAIAGLQRDDVFITSIVKYRPPKNRDPSPEEKAQSWPYLLRQLDVIKPKLVVTLGRHSTNCFLPKAKISEAHGTVQKYGNYQVMPVFHPAAPLYNHNMKKVVIEDFLILKDYLTDRKL